jgi:hypothetical protein
MKSAILNRRLIAAYLAVLVVTGGCTKKVYIPVKTEVEWKSTVYTLEIENATSNTFWLLPTPEAREAGVPEHAVAAGEKSGIVQLQIQRFVKNGILADNQVIPGAYVDVFGANTALIEIRASADVDAAPEEVKIDLSDHKDAGWYDEQTMSGNAVAPTIHLRLESFDHFGRWFKSGDRLVTSRAH